MAVGVPEHEVFAAADAVLARGERPTVERVRLELGRGSPARVGGLLDQWWARLAERLNGESRLPALPAEVSKAFVGVWQQAIEQAHGAAEFALVERRQELDAERERLAAVEDQTCKDLAQARQHATDALAARQAAETRLVDLEQLLAQCLAQIDDLRQQREALLRERGEALTGAQKLHGQLLSAQHHAEQERSAQDAYVRGVEGRAHREADRAREESKAQAAQLKAASRQQSELQRRLERAHAELARAQQQAAAQQARADTLSQHIEQLSSVASATRAKRVRKSSGMKN
ncbi:DNA-binding protein [Pseudomonas jessenii]|uniref:DNA-binding protein n=1 Tax=Pseudomonas jessenii TaxID=77298 RepID=UPI00389276F3